MNTSMMRRQAEAWSNDTIAAICADWEKFEQMGSIGTTVLRSEADKYAGQIGSSTSHGILRDITFEAYRQKAQRSDKQGFEFENWYHESRC